MNIFDILPYFHEAPWSYIVVPIMLITSIIGFYHKPFFHALLLHPYEVYRGKRLHTLLTSAFVHRNWLHMLNNLLIIYGLGYDMFGNIEQENNTFTANLLTPILFISIIVVPNLIQTFVKREDFLFTAVGASGLSFGLYGFSALYFPLQKMRSPIFTFVQNAFHASILLFILLFALTLINKNNNLINKHLHLSAYIIGIILSLISRPDSVIEIFNLF
ncbi:rhomboid family intramembrane serine protease [Sphingobacterium sp. UT-1RO-CII-1]|uniref:rhomboid family intramembrane serine protease n=1 Tax=Sphingobacterium sp. UT-1RO-CII-1 TaxID=2995225 RepID=UPI00227BE3F9|nr:rhomboid family intramembrane serine protease [Sphingobacterium sp. UT-1RO-CII-1]MCY4781210.1 rhomboid family intramembrane serine protease [Sphingobacterium sp. UT-1RO-CII-1]